jgi:hypothetical protein
VALSDGLGARTSTLAAITYGETCRRSCRWAMAGAGKKRACE